jgi:hypothetical protein
MEHHRDDAEDCPACDEIAEAHGVVLCRARGQHLTAADFLEDANAANDACEPAKRTALAALTTTAAAVAANLKAGNENDNHNAAPVAEWSLTIEDMMRLTGKTRRWLFRHKHLPFIRVISRKTIVGDETLLWRWISAQRA